MTLLSMTCGFGIIEGFCVKLEIKEHTLSVNSGFKTKTYNKEEIKSIHIAKGCPVILVLKEEINVELPTLNISPLALANIVRAWLKRS